MDKERGRFSFVARNISMREASHPHLENQADGDSVKSDRDESLQTYRNHGCVAIAKIVIPHTVAYCRHRAEREVESLKLVNKRRRVVKEARSDVIAPRTASRSQGSLKVEKTNLFFILDRFDLPIRSTKIHRPR